MKIFKQLPVVTLGVLAAAGSVTAKMLSPRALVKNCDQVTQELQNVRDMLKSAAERPHVDVDTLQLADYAKDKIISRHAEFLENLKDSRERLIFEGELAPESTHAHLDKLEQCSSVNGQLWTESEQLTDRLWEKALKQQKNKSMTKPAVSAERHPRTSPRAEL